MYRSSEMIIIFLLNIFSSLKQVHSTGLTDAKGEEIGTKKELVNIYSVYRKSLTWADAQIFCDQKAGQLATFVNIEQAQEVIEKIFEMSEPPSHEYLSGAKIAEWGLDRRYWIGLTDLVSGEGKWMWVGKGLPLSYNLWYPGQPDHYDKDGRYVGRPEHCVALWNPIFHKGDRQHSFADVECSRKYYFICEEDKDKLSKQEQWKSQNQDVDEQNKMGGGIIIGLNEGQKRERDREEEAVSKFEPSAFKPPGISGRGVGFHRVELGTPAKALKQKHILANANEFKELFKLSGSESGESVEDPKANMVSKSSEEFTPQDEVADVFAL